MTTLAILLFVVAIMGLSACATGMHMWLTSKREMRQEYRKQIEAGFSDDTGEWPKLNYWHIRRLEEEIYGHTFTSISGEPETPTYQEEYNSTHDKRPMVDPPWQRFVYPETNEWDDYEFKGKGN